MLCASPAFSCTYELACRRGGRRGQVLGRAQVCGTRGAPGGMRQGAAARSACASQFLGRVHASASAHARSVVLQPVPASLRA